MRGYVQVYTGNGKGKTTAAFGLALRASGAGLKVFIGQFMKGGKSGETIAVDKYLDGITVKQYGRKNFTFKKPEKEDIELSQKGLKEVSEVVKSGNYDIVILDEANVATYFKLISVDSLLEIIKDRPENVEILITGRNANPKLMEVADLVTEMKEIKHYYRRGIKARPGIEY